MQPFGSAAVGKRRLIDLNRLEVKCVARKRPDSSGSYRGCCLAGAPIREKRVRPFFASAQGVDYSCVSRLIELDGFSVLEHEAKIGGPKPRRTRTLGHRFRDFYAATGILRVRHNACKGAAYGRSGCRWRGSLLGWRRRKKEGDYDFGGDQRFLLEDQRAVFLP
jgi:hypothetical protein